MYIADPVCAVVKYTNEMALAPVKLVLTDNAVGSPPKHKVWLADGVNIVGQAFAVQVNEAEPKQIPEPPTGVKVIATASFGFNPEIVNGLVIAPSFTAAPLFIVCVAL